MEKKRARLHSAAPSMSLKSSIEDSGRRAGTVGANARTSHGRDTSTAKSRPGKYLPTCPTGVDGGGVLRALGH